jgi:hypothetical protein
LLALAADAGMTRLHTMMS